MWALVKDILGFMFDGLGKTIWLEAPKQNALLTILHGWIKAATRSRAGIPFDKFQSVILKLCHAFISIPSDLLDRLPAFQRPLYESVFRAADEAFVAGRVAASTKKREAQYANWCACVRPLGVGPLLQETPFHHRVRCLTGFGSLTRSGYFGKGKQVQSRTVSTAITAIGKTFALAHGINPTKTPGSDKLLPRLQEMLTGWGKQDPVTTKKLPVEVNIPELLVREGLCQTAAQQAKAIGDHTLVAWYYLLCNGEYITKEYGAIDTQTEQFKAKDVMFFRHNAQGCLYQVPRRANDAEIMTANCATLKLNNQKNGWKGVCINHEHNGDDTFCAVCALGRLYCHTLCKGGGMETLLSTYWEGKTRQDVTDKDIRDSLKWAAAYLKYLPKRGIPIDLVDTHSFKLAGHVRLPYRGIPTHRSRRWAAGVARRSKNIFGSSWCAIPRACQRQ
mmetsp:Transcript_24953/g.44940  ORF Transcript_24953/g.44940 Transcript_24953/m.44940 type:complete len:447 (-) Transcript_24953:968-2308(-)